MIEQDNDAAWDLELAGMIGSISAERVSKLQQFGGTVINVSSRFRTPGTVRICQDDPAVGELAARFLIARGFRSLGFVGVPDDLPSSERYAGFLRAAAEAGIAAAQVTCFNYGGTHRSAMTGMWQGLGQWLQKLPKPAGVLCTYDELGRLVAQCCWENQVDVPETVALVGVDNDPAVCESTIPPLSSVDTGAWRLGYEAAATLNDLFVGGRANNAPDQQLAPLAVVERASSALIAIDDPDVSRALRYIHDHAIDGIGVDDVLNHTPVNRRQLERSFKLKLNRTPYQEILRIRLEHACLLLQQTAASIKQVAARSGFVNLETFYRAFQATHAMTPKQYRESSRLHAH